MRKRLMEKLTKSKKGSPGYTLTELLVVIAIIAVMCAIAIPSIITINRALKFRQRNDYAKTIFLAAQANLSEMRSDGSLEMLQGQGSPVSGCSDFPNESWTNQYRYVTSDNADVTLYSLVLPVNSVESTLRNQQVIIEYNPYTGNVYAVFYSEEEDSIFGQYTSTPGLPRDDLAARRSMMLGYYDGSALASQDLELEQTKAELVYNNGEEGILAVRVPMPSEFYANQLDFMKGLSVELTITGDTSGGEITVTAKTPGNLDNCSLDVDGKTAVVEYPMDSLVNGGSFANKVITDPGISSLTKVAFESGFTILPGENVTVKAEVKFTSADAAVEVESGILPGINPLFEYLEPSTSPDKYVLAVSNGRNLQNLNVIAPSVAAKVDVVVFTDDVDWNATVQYYNHAYGNGGTYENEGEAPARCLPYFVPINNQNLFGSAYFDTAYLPVIQDKHDASVSNGSILPADHADVMGDGHRVVGLNIDATKYDAQTKLDNSGEYYVSNNYKYQNANNVTIEVENYQRVDYYFTGLFAYANTYIDGLDVVNPIVKGYSFTSNADITTATGALLGASGYNTLVTNCGVYIDKSAAGYRAESLTGPFAYNAGASQTWYGVSGQGSVGGLVGYAKSHRTASGNLTDDTSELAFSYCFAAVPVSGDMRGNNNKYYGYTNGVGGFIGNSELTNFYSCYSSGDVFATGCYVQMATGTGINSGFKPGEGGIIQASGTKLTDILQYEGRTSMGAGGFVGVSHGTRYTNCFTTGDVKGTGSATVGVGGFVGIMCYDEGFDYVVTTTVGTVTERIEQLTVFDSCYSTGKATINGQDKENFSGANARIYTYDCAFYVDYYKLFAPYYAAYGVAPSYPSTNDTNTSQKNDAYYIYKDSYYLSRNYDDDQINFSSNDCANVASYDMLTNLPGNHTSGTWLTRRVDAMGEAFTIQYTSNRKLYTASYREYYDEIYKNNYWTNTLVDKYKVQLQEGFPWMNWRSAISRNTHPYTMNGGIYPFSKLNNMDYYGDWPTRPLECGLAYYEDYAYEGNNKTFPGIFFDSEETSTIRKRDEMEGYTLVSDGYAVLSANSTDTITVTVVNSGKTYSLTGNCTGEFTPGGEYSSKSFAVFPLNKEIMVDAAAQVTEKNFYVELRVYVGTSDQSGKTYTLYFNPNVAKSNINPSSGTAAADPGDGVPDQILIRTARQLAALSTAAGSWGEDYRYVQEMDIDFASYTASSYGTSAQSVCDAIAGAAPIGNEEKPFNASYTGTANKNAVTRDIPQEDDSTQMETRPLFGVIGETGSVSNLTVNVGDGERTVTVGSAEADSIGIVANVVNGTLDGVDLVLSGPVSVTAKTNAGLAAGVVNGTLKNVNVTSEAAAAVQAVNAGSAVGATGENAEVNGSAVSLTEVLTLKGANCGGFAGSASGSAENVTVTLKGLTAETKDNVFAGGYAGVISGGEVKTVAVTLSGTVSSGSSLGGFAGKAENAVLSASTVTLNAGSTMVAQNTAGFVGETAGLTVQNASVNVLGKISGTVSAAGFAGGMEKTGKFSICSAAISGSIEAPTAAGFAVTADGDSSTCLAVLNGGRITGTTEAAGFAGTVSGTVYGDSGITGSGTVSAPKAAGFAVTVSGKVYNSRVTPAYSQSKDAYLGNSYAALTVSGSTTAAGFAVTVESIATVSNCDALGTIVGDAVSCFADTNAGIVDGCMANVVVKKGCSFVRNNDSGTVSYCYGWYGDGVTTDLTTFNVGGTCYSSYFVDIDVWDEDAGPSVVLYTSSRERKTTVPSMLNGLLADLNGTGSWWKLGGTFSAYPFSASLANKQYSFPMLRIHSGNWVGTPQYAYGVIYYERYSDGTLRYHVVDLSDSEVTVDKKSLTIAGNFGKDNEITETGYAVFCKNVYEKDENGTILSTSPMNPFKESAVGEARSDLSEIADAINKLAGTENRYGVYALNQEGQVTLNGTDGGSATLVTWYADAINVTDAPYQIRTREQFSNISNMSGAKFLQTHDIALDNAYTVIGTFGGSFDGNGCGISADTVPGLINTVSGTVTNMRFDANNATGSIFGTVSGTVQNSTISVGTTGSSVIGTVSGTVSGNTISVQTANVSGASDISFGIAASQVTSDGKLTGNTITGTVNVTGKDQFTATVGGIAGVNVGTISGGSANVTIAYTQATADKAVIGGLVGRMDGGSISNVTASGSVRLLSADSTASVSASGRSYIVGGAIGKDNGSAAYTGVTSEVAVDSNWAGSASISGTQDPMQQGPVGMFVGYVGSGSFENCASNAANTTYQFLGVVAVSMGSLPDGGDATWFSYNTDDPDAYSYPVGQGETLDTVAAAYDFNKQYSGYPYTICTAKLSNCTFLYNNTNNNTRYIQIIQPKEYFYLGELQSTPGGYQQTEVLLDSGKFSNKYSTVSNVTFRDLYSDLTDVEGHRTGYYYYDADGQNYVEIIVDVESYSYYYYTYYQYTLYAGVGGVEICSVSVQDRGQALKNVNGTKNLILYRAELTLSEGLYLITNADNTYFFNGTTQGVPISNITNGSFTQWRVDSNGYWKREGTDYFLFLNRSSTLQSLSAQKIIVSSYGSGFSLSGYNNRNTYYLIGSGQSFWANTEKGGIRLWTLEEKAASNDAVFTYQKLANLNCLAVKLGDDGKPTTPLEELVAINAKESIQSAAETVGSPGEITGGATENAGT